jgi:hypothetical protein
MRPRPAAWALIAAAILAMTPPPGALADGDPASDFLLVAPVFVPYTRPSQAQIDRLTKTVAAAKQRGYPIRVAVIANPNDLGSVPQEFGRPEAYAKFLDAEIQSAYPGRLLVVMPQGYGFRVGTHGDPASDKVLASLPPPASGSPNDLTAAATVAVRRLAAASGVKVPEIALVQPSTGSGGSSSSSLTLIVTAGAVLVSIVAAVIVFWPGRHDEEESEDEAQRAAD